MSHRRMVVAFLLAALCSGAAIVLELVRPVYFRQSESAVRDAIMRSGRMAQPNPDLIFLAIDNDSITLDPTLDLENLFPSTTTAAPESRRALELMANGWPWSREVYALIFDRLINAGAKVVALDCFFAEPGHGDDAFRTALDRFHDRVVIGSNFVTSVDVDLTHPLPSRYDLPSRSIIAPGDTPDDRIGFTNFFADEGRVVRAAQYCIAFRESGRATAATYLSLGARMAEKAGAAAKTPNDFAEHLIRFTGPPGVGFRAHPIFEIFVPEYWENNYRSGELFRDKIVIIGAAGSWQKDALITPFGLMPGAELHLNALNALLRGDFVNELPVSITVIIILFAAAVAAVMNLRVESPWLRLAILALASAGMVGIAIWSYNQWNLFIPVTASLLALDATVLLEFVADFAFERIEKLRLRSTLKTRDDLTHMIVHDLRSPLTIVTGYVGVLKQIATAKLGASEVECVTEALRGTDDMRDMITTLLDVGRLEAGEMPLNLETIDLSELAGKVVSRFGPVAGKRTLCCDPLPEPALVQCDSDVIRRVIANLINNAIKYTQPDGNILVDIEIHDATVILNVMDDGPGIPAVQHQHIFEKFGQTESGSQHRHSSGIGLAFCRMAIEAHGGKIGVVSELGRGSTFSFSLPLSIAAQTPALQNAAPV
jgi:signal transduction histidine kinase